MTNAEIAKEICKAWQANPGMAGEPDLETRIQYALNDKDLFIKSAWERINEKNHELAGLKAQLAALTEANRVMREALQLYAKMKPEKIYNATGMSEDEIVAELKKNPEMLIRMDGGRMARAALEGKR
jgi:hypothetical protein